MADTEHPKRSDDQAASVYPATETGSGPTRMLAGASAALGLALLQRKLARRQARRLADADGVPENAVQREATGANPGGQVHQAAHKGISGSGSALPHLEQIQRSFGPDHDVSQVQAHVGGAAAQAAKSIGAKAYAAGNHVAFRDPPSLHLAAHEAAHVVQQRAGVQLKGGVGETGDTYEQNADAIADRVVAGASARDLLPAAATQRRSDTKGEGSPSRARGAGSQGGLARSGSHTPGQSPAGMLQLTPDHIVKKRENLTVIAKRYGVTVKALMAENKIPPPGNNILPGQAIRIPYTTYTVKGGEKLEDIAKLYGVTARAIQAENPVLLKQVILLPGMQIIIHGRHAAGVTPDKPPPVDKPPSVDKPPPVDKPPSVDKPPPGVQPPGVQPPGVQPPVVAAGARGHQPKQDYQSGLVLEQSFLRKDDLSTKQQTQNGHEIYFKAGERVELVASHPTKAWIKVRGPAHEKTTPPRLIMNGDTAAPQTGWIERGWTDMTLGVYQDLAVDDLTREFREFSSGDLPKANVGHIVLHKTEDAKKTDTLRTYRDRMNRRDKKGRPNPDRTGAQYLIDETGAITLVVPANRRAGHTGMAHPDVKNTTAIGIEHTGKAGKIVTTMPRPKKPKSDAPPQAHAEWRAEMVPWKTSVLAEMPQIRSRLRALNLSPEFLKRLLAQTNKQLYQTLEDTEWQVHGDISGPQKRSSHLLTKRLRADFGLSQANVHAHEHVAAKTLGEGENIKEFLVAMEAYPNQVKELRDFATRRPDLLKWDPFKTVLLQEEKQLQELQADATEPENKALAAERQQGKEGAATKREAGRTAFYKDFWKRIQRLTELLILLQAQPAARAETIEPLLRNWRT